MYPIDRVFEVPAPKASDGGSRNENDRTMAAVVFYQFPVIFRTLSCFRLLFRFDRVPSYLNEDAAIMPLNCDISAGSLIHSGAAANRADRVQ